MYVSAVILAAGGSRRFGQAKMLSEFMGKPMLLHVVESACDSEAGETVLVTTESTIRHLSLPENLRTVVNNDKGKGMSHSIKLGLSAVSDDASAVLILLGDMPLLSPESINLLISMHEKFPERPIAASVYGILMPPVLFPRTFFKDLSILSGDRGARDLVRSRNDVVSVHISNEELVDVDTMENLEKAGGK